MLLIKLNNRRDKTIVRVRMVSKVSKVSKVPGGQRDAVRRGGQKFRIGAGDHIASMNRGHLLLWVVCAAGISQAMGYPQGDLITPDSDESDVSGIGFVTLDGTNSEGSVESGQTNASDDLIFLSRKKPSSSNNSVDLSPFLSMIYVPEVQAIVASYYHGDAEFQRAYAFLVSRDFADIKRKILQLPEVLEFTNYLSVHGLDVIKEVQSVADKFKPSELGEVVGDREPQNGLHGMVERIMEILPLDQLYVQFFDEFESNKQFAALVDSISSPKFAKILSGLQNSLPLRNLLFVLHNNSIFVERIVETVKSHLSLRGDFVSR